MYFCLLTLCSFCIYVLYAVDILQLLCYRYGKQLHNYCFFMISMSIVENGMLFIWKSLLLPCKILFKSSSFFLKLATMVEFCIGIQLIF